MKLQEATKQIIEQFGKSIVAEVRLANLLADLDGYEEYPAMKQVFKDTLKVGYGKKLYDIYSKNASEAASKAIVYTEEFSKESIFKEDLISYVFDCLLYGLGCVSSVNEPLTKGFDPLSGGDGNVLDNMDEQLANLKKKYLDLLDKLATVPNDLLKDAPGYYTTNALSQLYAIEAKISVYQQQLGKKDTDWCTIQRQVKIDMFRKQKSDVVSGVLKNLKKKYRYLLETSIIFPKKFFIKRSGYYEDSSLQELSKIEEDIKFAYYNMGQMYDNWCSNERLQYLAKYKVESSNVITQGLLKIGVPAAIIVVALGTGISYITSMDDINQFENAIVLGEQKASTGAFGDALQIFDKAGKSYGGSFRSGHYMDIAEEHINTNIDKIIEDCNGFVEQGKLVAANNLLKSLPQNIINQNPGNAKKIKTTQAVLTIAIDEGLENIIANISANNGHLDANAKERLNDLLAITPNDYWLNFINNKEK